MENRNKLHKTLMTKMAGNLIDVPLEPSNIDLAIDLAIETFRARSSAANVRGFLYLELERNVQNYYLPSEVTKVKKILSPSSSFGFMNYADTGFYPVYGHFLLGNNSDNSKSYGGRLTMMEAGMQYMELHQKMTASEIQFTFNQHNQLLTLHNVRATLGVISDEQNLMNRTIGIDAMIDVPEESLISGRTMAPWIRDWAFAELCEMLGLAYSKFSNIPSASGGMTLNGSELLAKAKDEKERLILSINKMENGEEFGGIVIG